MKADEGQAVCLQVAGRPEVDPGFQSPDIKIAAIRLPGDLLGKNVANHLSNHIFLLQERVVPEVGRDTDRPPRAG